MKHHCTYAQSPFHTGNVELKQIWEVWADEQYHVDARMRHGEAIWVIVRTLEGAGCAEMTDGTCYEMSHDQVAIFPINRTAIYYCTEPTWAFRWFEISQTQSNFFLDSRTFASPKLPAEDDIFQNILTGLRHPQEEYRGFANAGLLWLLSQWALHGAEQSFSSGRHQPILAVVEEMHRRLPLPWKVSEMSRYAGMSERSLRAGFHEIMGKAPSAYYEALRLNYATTLLSVTGKRIYEIAEQMGFSSPYHLSKWFKQQTGHAPSHFRP